MYEIGIVLLRLITLDFNPFIIPLLCQLSSTVDLRLEFSQFYSRVSRVGAMRFSQVNCRSNFYREMPPLASSAL